MKSIEQIRQENLKSLVNSAGGVGKFSENVGKSQAQVSQWLVGSRMPSGKQRSISSESAREMEAVLGIQKNWLDHEHQEADEQPVPALKDWRLDLVSEKKFDMLTHAEKCRVQVHMADEIEEILKSRQVSKKVA